MIRASGVAAEAAGLGIIKWFVKHAKSAVKKLASAAKAGYNYFKGVYEAVVPWIVRKAAAVFWTVYEIYDAFKDYIP